MRGLWAVVLAATFWMAPAQAQDVLHQETLSTPEGPLHYVLPEGYCLLEGSGGRVLAAALDRILPPTPHALTARFIPCADQRHVFEDKSWPVMHGYIKVQYDAHPDEPLPQILFWIHQSFWKEAQDSVLAKRFFDRELEAAKPPEAIPEDTSTLVGDLRPAVKEHWAKFMTDALRRTREPGFLRDGFPLGRDAMAVWWGGIEHSIPTRVLAMVSATTVIHGQLVSWVLERPITGPDTFDDLRGDLLPAVVATQHLANPPAVPEPPVDPALEGMSPLEALNAVLGRGAAPPAPPMADPTPPQEAPPSEDADMSAIPEDAPPVNQQPLPPPVVQSDPGPMVPGPGYAH